MTSEVRHIYEPYERLWMRFIISSTSNAVERANCRHRKMQKSIYRVRTREHISQRIAIDMQRDSFIDNQNCTINTLHHHKNNPHGW
jgi:hypothetical protein